MSHAHKLIAAIETCDPECLRKVIAQLQRRAQEEVEHLAPGDQYWERRCYINDRLPGPLGLTALHVAAKAYATYHQDPALAKAFDTMVSDLLDAGAVPWLEVGAQGVSRSCRGEAMVAAVPGRTLPQVCERHVPPSLAGWVAEQCDETGLPRPRPIGQAMTRQRDANQVAKASAHG